MAVSVSLARPVARAPIAFGLYLPETWAAATARREKAGVPEDVAFATKPELALAQMKAADAAGVARHGAGRCGLWQQHRLARCVGSLDAGRRGRHRFAREGLATGHHARTAGAMERQRPSCG
ncbi:hypothetical protein XthCFBP4691_20470, partial [Xanthomonas theicola]